MDELDSIAGDLNVQLQNQQETERGYESVAHTVQCVLSKAPMDLSHTSTLQGEALIESVQCVLTIAPNILSRTATLQCEITVDDTVVEPVRRVLSKASTGVSQRSTWHDVTPADSNTTQNYYENVSSAGTMHPMLDDVPTGFSCTSTW